MPNRAKGPRLHLRKGRGARKAHWVILDTGCPEQSTHCGEHDLVGAEKSLERYLAGKHVEQAVSDSKDPGVIPVADVIALYGAGPAKKSSDPKWTADRLEHLLEFFHPYTLGDVIGDLCRKFTEASTTDSMARRELEILRSAINHHRKEGKTDRVVSVVLPDRRPPRDRWLTRKEVADCIRAAWRYREIQKGHETDKRPRVHTAKFMLVAFYTGRRAGAICAAAFERMPGYGFIDLEGGVLYPKSNLKRSKKRQPPQPLPDRLLAHLRRWKAKGQRWVIEWDRQPIKRISKSHDAVVKEVGLKDVTPHTWRHTAATHQMLAGTKLWQAAGFLGMTEKQLEDGYGHHHPEFLEEARNAIGRRKV